MELKIIAVRVTDAENTALMLAGAQSGGLRPSAYLRKLAGLDPLKPGAKPGNGNGGRPRKASTK